MPRTRTIHCRCNHGCPTYAKVSTWDCGCVGVDVFNNRKAGSDCSNFSEMRNSCWRSGSPPHSGSSSGSAGAGGAFIGGSTAAGGGGVAVLFFIIGLVAIMGPGRESKMDERNDQQTSFITSVSRLRAAPSFSCDDNLTFGRRLICEDGDLTAIESYIDFVSTRQRDPTGNEHVALLSFIDQCQTRECVVEGGLNARLRQFDRENTMPDPRPLDAASCDQMPARLCAS